MNRRDLFKRLAAAGFIGAVAQRPAMAASLDPNDPVYAHIGAPFCHTCDPFGIVKLPKRSPWHLSGEIDDPINYSTSVMLGGTKLEWVYAVEIGEASWVLIETTEDGQIGRGRIDCPTCPLGHRVEVQLAPVWLDIDPAYWERFAEYERWVGRDRGLIEVVRRVAA